MIPIVYYSAGGEASEYTAPVSTGYAFGRLLRLGRRRGGLLMALIFCLLMG